MKQDKIALSQLGVNSLYPGRGQGQCKKLSTLIRTDKSVLQVVAKSRNVLLHALPHTSSQLLVNTDND